MYPSRWQPSAPLNDPAQMEEIIASGQADVVEMARALLADPELPNKVMAGREDEIIHCLRCFTCMAERPTTGTRRCAVNPLIGRECEGMDITPGSPAPGRYWWLAAAWAAWKLPSPQPAGAMM